MKKYFIIGLPKSGTTIISNYLTSLPNAYFFIEPHHQYNTKRSTAFLTNDTLRHLNLKYKPFKKRPLNDTLNKLLKNGYNYVGFKETFRGNSYKNVDKKFRNLKLITNYLTSNDFHTIPIIRDPLKVWNSLQRRKPKDSPNHWANSLDAYLENYLEFFRLIDGIKPILYEEFITNPIEVLANVLNIEVEEEIIIKPHQSEMGDPDANQSKHIRQIIRGLYYTEQDKKIICKSQVYKNYQNYIKSN